MNLYHRLQARADTDRPIRVGLIGAGKFATMFLAQANRTPGMQVAVIADLDPDRARVACTTAGWTAEQIAATSAAQAVANGTTFLTDDVDQIFNTDGVDVVVEATGHPLAGAAHADRAIAHGRHIVMVNVEADVMVGPLLARRAEAAGVVYSLAYGDQPALICEQVDWARAAGLEVVCAGKGTRYLPRFHQSTPDTIWDNWYGTITAQQAAARGLNPKMFNSFIDGTKSAIEMAAVANATGLEPPPDGLKFPPCGSQDLARITCPPDAGGQVAHRGTVEVVSSLERDGRPVLNNIAFGTYVTFAAADDYVATCFSEYGMSTDDSGRFSSLWRPYHLIGLELGISIASVGLRGEPTGAPRDFRGDAVATAKTDLAAGTVLDGEGGYTVYGKLLPAATSLAAGALPIGLAQNVSLTRPVAAGEVVTWDHVSIDTTEPAAALRRTMEAEFAAPA